MLLLLRYCVYTLAAPVNSFSFVKSQSLATDFTMKFFALFFRFGLLRSSHCDPDFPTTTKKRILKPQNNPTLLWNLVGEFVVLFPYGSFDHCQDEMSHSFDLGVY